MEEENIEGCISCRGTTDLSDLFAVPVDKSQTYAQILENCFNVKISDFKSICLQCIAKLENAVVLKEQVVNNVNSILNIKEEEYLDESILEEAECQFDHKLKLKSEIKIADDIDDDEIDDEHAIQALDETSCIYCDVQMCTPEQIQEHVRCAHGLEPRTGQRLRECSLCGVTLMHSLNEHLRRCHGMNSEMEGRQYPCHFCENVYTSRKACFTHLRMKHGLKLSSDQTPKYIPRERKKCHMCNRDFSQKQILNKHLWKAHGFEVEKRKAFICPLCEERVSYGAHFTAHLQRKHRVHEHVERLEFQTMDDFMLYKSAIQEETKFRFRKTTASKQTIEGLRSHYMCSQSGVYVYQGKGKRPAPERQIYKTGKACPAHMIVTETVDRVLVTFHKTHVGHGACPYYEPREPKKIKTSPAGSDAEVKCESDDNSALSWICDCCGMVFLDSEQFKMHASAHRINDRVYPCRYCPTVFQNIESWTHHQGLEHGVLF